MKFQKIAIGIVMATSLVSCVGNQDHENLSTKSPVLNKVQLSGYSSKYYIVDELVKPYVPCSEKQIQPIMNNGGVLNLMLCKDRLYTYQPNTLITIKNDETKYSLAFGLDVDYFSSGFDDNRANKNNILLGRFGKINNYSYDFVNVNAISPSIDNNVAITPDGNIGFLLNYNPNLTISKFNAYEPNQPIDIFSVSLLKNTATNIIKNITNNKLIINIALNDEDKRNTIGSIVYDVKTGIRKSISTSEDNESLYLATSYDDNVVGVSQVYNQKPRLMIVNLPTGNKSYQAIPNAVNGDIVTIIGSSQNTIYYKLNSQHGFYDMRTKRFYDGQDVLTNLLSNYLNVKDVDTIKLTDNDRYLLIGNKERLLKITFDDSFHNFLQTKIIPLVIK